ACTVLCPVARLELHPFPTRRSSDLKALVTPQALPLVMRTRALSAARTTPPTHIGQDPRTILARPRAVGTAATGGGVRRRSTRMLAPAMAARTSSVTARAPP